MLFFQNCKYPQNLQKLSNEVFGDTKQTTKPNLFESGAPSFYPAKRRLTTTTTTERHSTDQPIAQDGAGIVQSFFFCSCCYRVLNLKTDPKLTYCQPIGSPSVPTDPAPSPRRMRPGRLSSTLPSAFLPASLYSLLFAPSVASRRLP